MQFIGARRLEDLLDYRSLAAALRADFASGGLTAPLRTGHVMHADEQGADSLLVMPAWGADRRLGVKLVTVRTSSRRTAGHTVNAIYVLFDPATGEPVACLDGDMLTKKRTAAISALAASFMARPDADRLLMVGTGAMCVDMVCAHAALRTLQEISIFGRDPNIAAERVGELRARGLPARPADDLAAAVGGADIICCATTAREPVVRGAWLRPGQHLDLVGGFRPDMRETDDEAVSRSRVGVDTRDGVLAEAGDMIQPIAAGVIDRAHIVADLAELCAAIVPGRTAADEITLFKSVGTGMSDLSAARFAVEQLDEPVKVARS